MNIKIWESDRYRQQTFCHSDITKEDSSAIVNCAECSGQDVTMTVWSEDILNWLKQLYRDNPILYVLTTQISVILKNELDSLNKYPHNFKRLLVKKTLASKINHFVNFSAEASINCY